MITRKHIRFISYHLIFIALQEGKQSFLLALLNLGFFQTFNVVKIQHGVFRLMQKSAQLFNQAELMLQHCSNKY